MINLIPPAGQQAVRKEYMMRVYATYATLFSVVVMLLTIALVPTYVLVQAQMRGFVATGSTESVDEDMQVVDEEIKRMEAILAELKKIPNTLPMSGVIRAVEESAPPGITFNTVTMKRTDFLIAPVEVRGIAARRENLIAFKQALEANPRFESASVPIADLAKERDVPFSITITVAAGGVQ